MLSSTRNKAIFALIIANIIWGAASPIFKFSLENIPPFTLAFIRFFFASFLFLPFTLKYLKQLTRKNIFEIVVSSFFGITVNISAFFLGLAKTTSINAPIIASAGPVFIYLLSLIFLKEVMNRKVLLGMIIALLGVLFIIFSPILFDGNSFQFGEFQGNLLFLIATLGAVFNTILNKDILRKVHPLPLTYVGFIFGAFTFLPFMLGELQSWNFSQLDMKGWTGIIYGILLSSAIAYFLFNYAMSKLNAQEVGIFTYIDPVAAIIIAIPLLGEVPSVYFVAGSMLVFGGIFIAEKRIQWHPLNKLKM